MAPAEDRSKDLGSYFIGREAELSELKRYLTEANDSVGRLVLVCGEAGIGKTVLVNEAGKFALQKGMRFLRGKCLYQENIEPYLPFLDALRQYFSQRAPEDQAAQAASEEPLPLSFLGVGSSSGPEGDGPLSGEMAGESLPIGLLPIAAAPEQGAPRENIDILAERDRMFDTITQLVINISHENPLLLFIDDLQWADTSSLQLLHYLARRIARSRVMLVCAYRPEELEDVDGKAHPLKAALQRLGGEKLSVTIELQRLQYEHISVMVRKVLAIEEVPDSFIRLLYDESEGNPLFVEEVLKSLVEEGIIKAHSYVWDFEIDVAKIRIPDTIKDIIQRRISNLSEDGKRVLMYCSIIGHQFSFSLLSRVSEMPEEKLLDAIDEILAAKLIKEEPSSKEELYSFDHVQVRSVVTSTLSKSRVRVMHKKVGEVLEEMHKKNIDEAVFSLAHHYSLGKDMAKAIMYSERAGEKSMRLYAMDDAIKYYEWALVGLEEGEQTYETMKRKIGFLTKLGELSNLISSWPSAIEYYKRLVKLSEDMGDKRMTAEAHRNMGESLKQMGSYDEARTVYEQALRIYESIKDIKGVAQTHRGLGYINWRHGEHDRAIAHYNICLQNSMRSGDIQTIARALIDLGNVYNYKAEFEKSINYYQRGIDELGKIGDLSEMSRAYVNLGDTEMRLGHIDKSIAHLDKARTYAEKIGSRLHIAWGYYNSSEAHARKGDIKRAREHAERALRIMERINDTIGMSGVYRVMGIILRMEKKFKEAGEMLERSRECIKGMDVPFEKAELHHETGLLLVDVQDYKGAADELTKAEKQYSAIGAMKRMPELKKQLESIGQ